MHAAVMNAFKVIDATADESSILEACKALVLKSDDFIHSNPPFSADEVLAIATAIYEYIECPDSGDIREIRLHASRQYKGHGIDYFEYAANVSEDMLYSARFGATAQDLNDGLKVYLAAILYRYQFCAFEDRASFPVSMLVDYFQRVSLLLASEQNAQWMLGAVSTTLEALACLEPVARREAEIKQQLSDRQSQSKRPE